MFFISGLLGHQLRSRLVRYAAFEEKCAGSELSVSWMRGAELRGVNEWNGGSLMPEQALGISCCLEED